MSFTRMTFSLLGAGLMMTSSALAATSSQTMSLQQITPQALNQSPQNYIGKQVVLTGKIDRVLGNGAYIVCDSKTANIQTNRVLVFTSFHDNDSKMGKQQQAGTMASSLKEGDSVQLNGRVEQFSVSSEVDSFSPKNDSESVSETTESTPVLVIQPGATKTN